MHRPLVAGGTYTGGIEEALVGDAKARAVLAHALANNVDLAGSFAYGGPSFGSPIHGLGRGNPCWLTPS